MAPPMRHGMQRFFKGRFLMLVVVVLAASCSPTKQESAAPGEKPTPPAIPALPSGTSSFKLPPPPAKPGSTTISPTGTAGTTKQEPKPAASKPAANAQPAATPATPTTAPKPADVAKPAAPPKPGAATKSASGGQSPLVGTWVTIGPGSPRRLEIKESGSGAVLLGDIPWIRFTWVKDGNDLVATHVDNDVKFRIAARGEGRLSWRAADGGSAKEVEYERER